MWKLIQNLPKLANYTRYSVLNNSCRFQFQKFQSSKIQYKTFYTKPAIKTPTKKPHFSFSTCTKIGVALTTGGIFQITLLNTKALCKAKHTRMSTYKISPDDAHRFDWARFWKYVKPYIWYLIAAIGGALVVAILNIQIPQVMGAVINIIARYTENKNSELFIQEMTIPAVKLSAMYIGQSIFTFFYIYMLSNLGEKISFQMRTDLFSAILKQDIAFFDEQRTGEIINRLTSDIQDFKSSFKQTVSGGLRAGAQIVGCSVSLLMISPYMTFITLLCIPTVIAVGTLFGTILRNISRKAQAQVEKTTAVADEAVSNIRTVRAFAMEDQEQELFDTEAEVAMTLNESLGFGIGWFQAGTNLFLNGTVLITLYMGGYLLSTDQLSPGELMAYLMASQTIQRSLGQMSLLFGSVVRGISAGSRVFEYMELEPRMSLKGGSKIPDFDLKGNIEFKNVTFAYPSRQEQCILKDFNLTIPCGKTLAIVGASGNGKSTVVALIERFYDVNCGEITLDGYDIKTLDPSWLRKRVLGLISQEPILFGTSVMENIRYGRPSASDEDVKNAAVLANAHDFISGFPNAYDTMVGERGVTLSGGQKQRIAIARALLKDPAVLLLDEATSALDTESEKVVQTALEKAKEGRTVVVIAHRLSTIQNADIIVVLHKGVIVEMGTHEELTKKRGHYWSLTYQQQEVPAA